MTTQYDAILLASGGLDSTVMAYWLRDKGVKFIPLFLDYGQHFIDIEYSKLSRLLPEEYKSIIKVIKLHDIYEDSISRMIKEPNLWKDTVVADDLYLPYRNTLFLTVAAAYAQSRGIKKIYSAFINSNHAKEIDCSVQFFDTLGKLLSDYGTVTLEMPFRNLDKTQVAKIGLELKVPIAETFSCQANSEVHCGVCPNCVDRLEALKNLIEGSA
jgi:7-cyano-7-deazaguanine synthase